MDSKGSATISAWHTTDGKVGSICKLSLEKFFMEIIGFILFKADLNPIEAYRLTSAGMLFFQERQTLLPVHREDYYYNKSCCFPLLFQAVLI